MNKIREFICLAGKNKKAVFILVSCVALLVFGVVYKLTPGAKADKESVKKPQQSTSDRNDLQSEDVSSDVTVNQEETVPTGVEVVDDVDEYFAGLRVENSDIQSNYIETCEQIRTSILTRGYEDAFVCVTEDNTLEITVLCTVLTEDEVGVIASAAADVFEPGLESITIKGICAE